MLGGVVGAAASQHLLVHKGLLNSVFAALIFCAAIYMFWESWAPAWVPCRITGLRQDVVLNMHSLA